MTNKISKPKKLKDILQLKRQYIKEKNLIDNEIETIRDKKKFVQDELIELKHLWKLQLLKSKTIQKKIYSLSKYIKKKKQNGKRGFRMSGLSIDIRDKLDQSIIDFFSLDETEEISRVIIMKNLFHYIKTHNIYMENDKRFIDLQKGEHLDALLNLFQVDKTQYNNQMRIQKFRHYIEKILKVT